MTESNQTQEIILLQKILKCYGKLICNENVICPLLNNCMKKCLSKKGKEEK